VWTAPSAAEREQRIRGSNPLGVMLTADQVAGYVRLLADPAATALTGEVLRLDGGRSLNGG
jgi:NAD(P)-dependent dehydrogenase (short-subunit alcohol dehydrogenase family)